MSITDSGPLLWCEVDTSVLAHNMQVLKAGLQSGSRLGAVVKSEAYGHGLELAAKAFCEGGADWLIMQTVDEAKRLRAAGITCPLFIVGYVPMVHLDWLRYNNCRAVVYDADVVEAAGRITQGPPVHLHLKLETGNHRQGLSGKEAVKMARRIESLPFAKLEGISTHFANVEDTTDHAYAMDQMSRFRAFLSELEGLGISPPIKHTANSAATVLFPDFHQGLVRAGLISYGMWPSPETLVSTFLQGQPKIDVRPALTWKARIVQVKTVPKGGYIGYGCTYMATHDSRIAVVPVGYFEGYDRGLSNLAHTLVKGQRAPVRGRVCMNFIMVDVTDIEHVGVGDEVVLLGRQGAENISAELMASWAGTINYEITTRIAAHLPRLSKVNSELS